MKRQTEATRKSIAAMSPRSSPPPVPPAAPPPSAPAPLRRLGAARRVKRDALIYLFEPLIHQPLQMTLAADDYRITLSPLPSATSHTHTYSHNRSLRQDRHVRVGGGGWGVIIIKNTQIRKQQWMVLQAGEGDRGVSLPQGWGVGEVGGEAAHAASIRTQFTGW